MVRRIDTRAALLWLLKGKSGLAWCVLLLVYPLTQWLEQPVVQAVHGCRLSAMEAFGRTSSSALPALPRCSHLENWTPLLWSCIFQLILAFGCCLWSTAYWIFREILRAPHLVRQWIHVLRALRNYLHIFYVAVNSNPEAFALHSCRMEKCAQLMLLVAASLSAVRMLEVGIISTSAPFFDSLRQFSLLSAAFFGALDDEELFIIEGSCQLDRSVVWTNTLQLR